MGNCEMCGREAPLKRAMIEGAVLELCPICAKHGKILESTPQQVSRARTEQRRTPAARPEVDYLIVDNYAKLIRDARERMGLKQEEFAKRLNLKESQVQKMETGNFKPSLKMAAKLQNMLRIKLIEEDKETGAAPTAGGADNGEGMTIADFIKKK
jgi:putative transcription factor